tara:strand:- start:22217 stop:22858 length:642 start_codon:yes stop_codon:yes gene_type:complete
MNDNAQIILAALTVTGAKPTPPVRAKINPADYDSPESANAAAAQAAADYDKAFSAYTDATAAYDQNLKANAREIKVMLGEKSRIGAQLNALDKAIAPDNDGGKVFVGTIVSVTKEEASQRAQVTMYTGTDRTTDGVPAGCERVRTDRTDNLDGRAIARSAQLLIGHRVTVYVELEAIRNGTTKVRVARHFEDNGVNPDYDAATGTVRTAARAA